MVVSLNGEAVLPACLAAVAALNWPRESLDVVIVDNGSSDSTGKIVDEWAKREGFRAIHLPRNLGFAGGNNVGIKETRGDFVILLNDDTEVFPNWVTELVSAAQRYRKAGILGTLLLYGDRITVQHAGGAVLRNGFTAHRGSKQKDEGQFNEPRVCDYVTGAAFAIRREVLETIGLLDADYWPIYFEEIDYCFRAKRAGFEVLQTAARAVHHESQLMGVMSPRFIKNYNRSRHRFILLNFSPAQVLLFPLRELWWLFARNGLDTFTPKLFMQVYGYTLLKLPVVLWRRLTGRRRE